MSGLQPQVVPLIFEGLDTFTDPKRGLPTKLDLLENCYISTPLKLQKRPGFTSGSKSIDGGGSVSAGAKLMSYQNESVMCDGSFLYTKDSISGLLAKRGKLPTGQVKIERITGDTLAADRLNVTGCYAGGVILYAWQVKSLTTVSWRLYDSTTGALLNNGSHAGNQPRAVACGGFLFLFSVNGTALEVRKVNPASPTVMSGATTAASGASSDTFDVTADTATPQLLTAVYHAVADTISVRTINPTTLAIGGPTTFTQAGGSSPSVISWLYHDYSNGSAYVSISWAGVGVGTYVYDINTSTRAMSNATQVDATSGPAGGLVANITGYFSTNRTVFIERFGATTDLNFIKGWNQGTSFELVRGVTLSSKVFKQGTRYYIALSFEDTTQRHRVLLEYEHATNGANGGSAIVGYLAAKDDGGLSPGGAGATPCPSNISEPINFGSGVWGLPWHYSFDLGSHYGVASHRLTFSESGLGRAAQFADTLWIPGFQLNCYDGAEVVEQGFYTKPKAPTLSSVAGGSVVNGGTYLVKLVWRWTDARGRTWRSQAGPATSVVTSNVAIQAVCPTLRLTNKDPKFNQTSSVPQVAVDVYRTTNGGTTYYYDNTTTNSVTADTVTVTLTQSDANLSLNAILYSSGGVLSNETPPAVRLVRAFGLRLFVCAGDGDIWHSKGLTGSDGVAFSSSFRIPLDTSAGKITALFDIDQTFVMGQRNGAYVLGGGNPTDTGMNLFGQPQRINTDIGPIDDVSVVRLPAGVAFNTPRGIHLMSRGLDSQFIGSAVQRYTLADTITGSVALDSRNHAAWTTSDGDLLVYDYVLSQWYVWTGLAAVACALYGNTLAILASDGTIKTESPGVFSDDSTAIVMKIRTAWLALAGFGGYQRLWSVSVIGEYKGAHTLQVSFSYNYSTFINETLSTNAGSATYNNGIEDGYAWEAVQKQQLCSAVQITVNDSLVGAGSEGFYLTGLALEIGVVGGTNRFPSNRSLA